MSPQIAGTKTFRRGGLSVTLLVSAAFGVAACGGSESSGEASSMPAEGGGAAASADAGSSAPLGTGFIMISELSQLQMTEGTFLEESDCTARVSALGDDEEYAACVEVPPVAICLQAAEGLRESDKWWECFGQMEGCEEAIAGHEVVREVGGYVREILQGCSETEMASVFASM